MTKYTGEYPKNLAIQGELSFPLTSESDLEAVAAWRVERNIKKPKFDDKIGVTLLLGQEQYDKALAYYRDVYLPFVEVLYKETDGEKGVDAKALKVLTEQAKKEEWLGADGRPNTPFRNLNDKDKEHSEGKGFVAKFAISGPYNDAPFEKKALIQDADGSKVVVTIPHLVETGVLSEKAADTNRLWWGSGWNFKSSVRLNAYDTAKVGVTAYGTVLYLLPHLGLPMTGGNSSDSDVVEDDDDWS